MNVAEARALLTDRAARVRTQAGKVVVGVSLENAERIAALLKAPPETPVTAAPPVGGPPPTAQPERVVDTESGPIKVPQKKKAVKKTKKRGKR